MATIETGAISSWRMPWHTLADAGTPANVDGRPYRGTNSLWLPMVSAARDWTSGVWATYRGWQRHDAQVRRGEKATQVVLWKTMTPTDPDTEADDDGKGPRRGLIARTYSVFAAEQVDGADEILGRRAADLAERDTPERMDAVDGNFAAVGATVIAGGNRAYFQPSTDSIHVPALAQFETAAHPSRDQGPRIHPLDRDHRTNRPRPVRAVRERQLRSRGTRRRARCGDAHK